VPAAELTRLRTQITGLLARFYDSSDFLAALRDLLDQYANRAYRSGQTAQPQSLLPSYRVPPLVMRQLELELSKASQEKPDQALAASQALWQDPHLEPRRLAAVMLGAVPAAYASNVSEILRQWALPGANMRMLETLFKVGTQTLRRAEPRLLLQLIEDWLSQPETQALGLWMLIPVIEDPEFENLPPIFRLIGPLVQNIPAKVQTDLTLVVEAMAQRTPTETAFFFRQALPLANGQATARLVRRCMPIFPAEQQASLREALKSAGS
jgi:hypothetical protein